MRIIFMGTPQFAVPSLQTLIDHPELGELVAVVTQPDAPAGRGNVLTQSPVKQLALQHGLPILQPPSLKPADEVAKLRDLRPDVIIVAAFGQILRRDVLDLPPHRCINVHASLLPRWRGASPISAAIGAGDASTGVTIMLMELGLDSGPMLSQRAVPIEAQHNTGTLTPVLAQVGADLLTETLPRWLCGEIVPQPQDAALVTHCRTLKKEAGKIEWTRPAVELERHIRAMSPWPSASTTWQGKNLKILKAAPSVQFDRMLRPPGQVFAQGKQILVACGGGAIELIEIQLEGKKAASAGDFARGQREFVGAVLK
ncbi:MAG: methionyl-tRNA formyltransferase [Chloroflexi bacterium]|jgi:methionyl-tRNA formyltransferase|nr:methionyl-tRNA formyltransferase [Chloroflexota bacterium]